MSIIIICLLVLFILVASQVVYIKVVGEVVTVPAIPRGVQTVGASRQKQVLRYAVLGDSTSISQGGTYAEGYAYKSAEHLAKTHIVQFLNVGVSGARAADVAAAQVAEVTAFVPDIALIAVGANDVTHITNLKTVATSLKNTVAQLRKANPNVRIILTGSPDMGSIPRFPQPTRWLAGARTKALNNMVQALCHQEKVTFAPIARETGPMFRAHPELFAEDKFHPNTAGYAVWTPVVLRAIDTTLNRAQ